MGIRGRESRGRIGFGDNLHVSRKSIANQREQRGLKLQHDPLLGEQGQTPAQVLERVAKPLLTPDVEPIRAAVAIPVGLGRIAIHRALRKRQTFFRESKGLLVALEAHQQLAVVPSSDGRGVREGSTLQIGLVSLLKTVEIAEGIAETL
jgi:hypothetical protein